MAQISIPWAPRLILAGRVFRLPIRARDSQVSLSAEGFQETGRRWCSADQALYVYLRAPEQSGTYCVTAVHQDCLDSRYVEVRSLNEMRQPFVYNGATWPRRWPVGLGWTSSKGRQTLQDVPAPAPEEPVLNWWLAQDDASLWRQLPPAELPRAHFVNVHQGCPSCGTAVFRHNGFYPWIRQHLPVDFKSRCPACGSVYPSNDLAAGDFVRGDFVDDGYGYFDAAGHLFLFAATYHRDQTRAFAAGMDQLTRRLRQQFDPTVARRLGLLLLRQAVEEVYLAAAPQFRYGPTLPEEQPWAWGQPDWAAEPDPIAALFRKGTVHYCIDLPYVIETFCLAYDTLWPFLSEDEELAARAQALGAPTPTPAAAAQLVEEMLAGLVQASMDGSAASNLPRVSQGVLVILAALDRGDAQPVLEWLYDRGPDRMRVFGVNDFMPDGTPPEATGGYNSIHSDGLFALEHDLRRLRRLHPEAYPEARFPSLMADPRAARVARAPVEIGVIGRSYFQVGDGGGAAQPGRLTQPVFSAPMAAPTLSWAAEFTGDATVARMRDAATAGQSLGLGTTVHDGAGIAILRTGEAPERAAVGITYGDPTGHRHMDLLDVQLFAFERQFLTDLGYPQSWASFANWEANWATHNAGWAVVPGVYGGNLAGRGRLVRVLEVDGVHVLEVWAERWAWDSDSTRWFRPGAAYRRLLALVETDGEGVALVDLMRLQGGTEHWRVCRGLQGTFVTQVPAQPRPGTLAGEAVARGAVDQIARPDYAGLAYMDDVRVLQGQGAWTGQWQHHTEPGTALDLHQLASTDAGLVATARATAIMGTPSESAYEYRAVAWQASPVDVDQVTKIDLVFEPRVDAATLIQVESVAVVADSGDATPTLGAAGLQAGRSAPEPPLAPGAGVLACGRPAGVRLRTRAGREVALYWAPGAGPEQQTRFEDGTVLTGALAVSTPHQLASQSARHVYCQGRALEVAEPLLTGTIAGVDSGNCRVTVQGLAGAAAGDRVVIDPAGRAHSYRIDAIEPDAGGIQALKLDVTPMLGRCQVKATTDSAVEMDFLVMARTGNLEGVRLLDPKSNQSAIVVHAWNPDGGTTHVTLDRELALKVGEWVELVTCVPGDPVVVEPVASVG